VQRAFRRPPVDEMREMGFGELELLRTFQVHLAGSQRQLNAYIFRKPSAAAPQRAAPAATAAAAAKAAADPPRAPAAAPARRGGAKRGLAVAAAAAAAAAAGVAQDDAASDASCDTQLSLPLEQWLRVNGLGAEASHSSEATSQRVRRKRRLS
jgi:hypothetical protein